MCSVVSRPLQEVNLNQVLVRPVHFAGDESPLLSTLKEALKHSWLLNLLRANQIKASDLCTTAPLLVADDDHGRGVSGHVEKSFQEGHVKI